MLARVGRRWLSVVVRCNLPEAGRGAVPLELKDFVGSVPRLAWAKENGSPWNGNRRDSEISRCVARGGHLEVLQWAREKHCGWDVGTCAELAHCGHLETMKWARAHGCPWDMQTPKCAARGGHLEVLQWAREHHCEWYPEYMCTDAAWGMHPEVLKWAREHDCPWDELTCTSAASGGQLEVLKWARERDCPWNWRTLDVAAFFSECYSGALRVSYEELLTWAMENGCPQDYPISP
jgi:hypothetical protein